MCIPWSSVCDGIKNCPLRDDEKQCACGDHDPTKYRCQGRDGKCIPTTWKCDGVADCPMKDDERGCVNGTLVDPYTCMGSIDYNYRREFRSTGILIPAKWK